MDFLWGLELNLRNLKHFLKPYPQRIENTTINRSLYIFGIMGNARYGLWDSNDASMIMAVGKINDSFPDFIPKSYAWAYIYAISPLSNLFKVFEI